MSTAVILLVTALLFVVLGYQLNRADGRFEQGGLVQFDSRPSGATVSIDGTEINTRTTTKNTLSAGNHTYRITRDGYSAWQKSVNLAPGAVLWLNYARLIPKDIKQERVADFATVSSSVASPNAQFIVAKEDPATPIVRLADISRTDVKQKDLVIPQASFTPPATGKTQRFELVSWDPSSKYIVVKHLYNDAQAEWLIVDTTDVTRTRNVTTLLNIQITKLLFNNADSAIVYVQTANEVRRIDLNAATLSRPLITNVAEFDVFDRSTLVFTTLNEPVTKTRVAGYYEDGAETPHVIRSFIDDGTAPLHIAIAKYFEEPYIVISYSEKADIIRGRLPTDEQAAEKLTHETTVIVPGGVQYVDIRTKGRFVVMQKDADYYVYDNELKQLTKTGLSGTGPVTGKMAWLDGYILWSNRGGMLRLYEFDGANQHDVMPVTDQKTVALTADDTYIYAFTPGENGVQHLTRARLVLP